MLVHSAWPGGWCWRKIAPLLRAHGHDVYAPTLTGLGERAHLIQRDIGLAAHVEDIVNVPEFEDLRGVILVGDSSGGMVITGVAERTPERIAQLVYLDAFVPNDGQSLVDLSIGPYAFVRHPLRASELLFDVGLALEARSLAVRAALALEACAFMDACAAGGGRAARASC